MKNRTNNEASFVYFIQKTRPHHAFTIQQLHWLPVRWATTDRIQDCLSCASVLVWSDTESPMYLAADIQLAVDRGRQNLRSASVRTCCTDPHFRWQEFFCRWTSCVEQFACRPTTWDAIRIIQATTLNSV